MNASMTSSLSLFALQTSMQARMARDLNAQTSSSLTPFVNDQGGELVNSLAGQTKSNKVKRKQKGRSLATNNKQ